jgi:hypothetical protein
MLNYIIAYTFIAIISIPIIVCAISPFFIRPQGQGRE